MKRKFQEEIRKFKNIHLEKVITDKWRGRYHLMAPIGWINDPNGLCYFKEEYHVYYQYSPLDPRGGLKFWGHYTSKDLVNWKEEEIALYPDVDYDKDGVYSGSAFVKDDEIYFFYTGNVKHEGEHDYILTGREQNVILVTSKDGINFSEKKLLLTNTDFPSNMSLHVRDPKVWEEDGTYYMVLGARGKDNKGYILVYKSNDLEKWSIHNEPIGGIEKLGYMWECPDVVKFEDKKVLLLSPQGMDSLGYKFRNVYQSGYIVNEESEDIQYGLNTFIELDRGFDFYAPQTFKNHDGRVIMIGWMGVPDAVEHKNPTVDNYWQHQLTIPRELRLKDNKIFQIPVKELEALRKEMIEYKDLDISEKVVLDMIEKNTFELEIDFEESNEFEINLREDCKLIFKDKIFKLHLGKSGYGRDERAVEVKEIQSVRVYSDNSSLEVFLNDGAEVFSTRIYNEGIDKNISIVGIGKANVKKWNI